MLHTNYATHLPGGLAGVSEGIIEAIQLRVPLEHYTNDVEWWK